MGLNSSHQSDDPTSRTVTRLRSLARRMGTERQLSQSPMEQPAIPEDVSIATLCKIIQPSPVKIEKISSSSSSSAPAETCIPAVPSLQLEPCSKGDFWMDAEWEEDSTSHHSRAEESALSIGSSGHFAGTCTPCKFFRQRRGCRDGSKCNLCHFPHTELTHSGIRKAMRLSAQRKREQARLQAREAQTSSNDMPTSFPQIHGQGQPQAAATYRQP